MSTQQQIPCPDCGTPIYFDPYALVTGQQFKCSGCQAVISLAMDSRSQVQEAMQKFDTMKQDLMKQKTEHR